MLKNKIFKHITAVSNITAVTKKVYFYVLDNIVNKYNNTIHRTITMKRIDITSDSYAEYNKDPNKKSPNLKLVIVSEYQNTKTILPKHIFKIGQKKFLLLAKLEIQFRGHMLFVIWMANQLLELFIKKNCIKQISKNSE